MAQKDKVKELVGKSLNFYHTKALQQIDRIKNKNKEQSHKISMLTNELDNDYLNKTEEGSVISLDNSKEGMVYLDELQGNTMVNYCKDGSKEMVLNGDIDVEGTFVTTTEGVDNGLVDVMCEGHTAVNISKTKDITPITMKYDDIVGNNGKLLKDSQPNINGSVEIEKIVGNTLVNRVSESNIERTLNGNIDEEGVYVTTTEGADGGLVDVILEGHTAVNISKTKDPILVTHKFADIEGNEGKLEGSKVGSVEIDRIVGNTIVNVATIENVFHGESVTSYYKDATLCETSMLKLGADYTIIIFKEYLDNHNENYNYFEFGVSNVLGAFQSNIDIPRIRYNENKSEVLVKKVNFNDFKGYKYLSCRPCRRSSTPVDGEEANYLVNVIILEGDYTNKPIPNEIFNGLQSSFESNLVTQDMIDLGIEDVENLGKYKVPIKLVGKNKLQLQPYDTDYTRPDHSLTYDEDGTITLNGSFSGHIRINKTNLGLKIGDIVNISIKYISGDITEPNAVYIAPYSVSNKWAIDNPLFFNGNNHSDLSKSGTILEDILYFTIWNNIGVIYDNYKIKIQVEKIDNLSDIGTSYEPYFERTTNVYLNSPLLKDDEIVMYNGQLCHCHKYNEMIFDGSSDENWVRAGGSDSKNTTSYFSWNNGKLVTNAIALCDKLPTIPSSFVLSQYELEGLRQSSRNIYININKSRLASDSIGEFKTWLKDNPLTIVYQLAEPWYEPIGTDSIKLDCTTNATLSLESNIPIQTISTKSYTETLDMLKPNTEYRVSFECDVVGESLEVSLGGSLASIIVSSSYNSLLLTTPSTLVNNDLVIDGQGCNISKVVITEGNLEYPYFEGMKSVGQDDINGHKIETISRNKNLFDGVWVVGSIDYDTGKEIGGTVECRTDYIDIGNIQYLYKKESYDKDIPYPHYKVRFYDANKEYLGTNEGWKVSQTKYLVPMGAKYIRLVPFGTNIETMSNIELIISTEEITEYIEPKQNKKHFILNAPLRGFSNGVKDRFAKIDGKWYIERNCKIKSSSDLFWLESGRQFENYFCVYARGFGGKDDSKYLSISYPYIEDAYANYLDAKYISNNSGKGYDLITLTIKKSELSTVDLEGAKEYLANNPFDFLYELATPIYEPLEIDPTLTTYLETTHISNNSIIPCNMKVKNTGYNLKGISPNTEYTVIYNGEGSVVADIDGTKATSTTNNIIITTPTTLTDSELRLYGKGVKVTDVMVIDGKVTDIEQHIEGLQSSFESNLVTQEMINEGLESAENLGKYKVPIKLVGKNKFDGVLELGRIDSIGNMDSTNTIRSKNYIEVKPNMSYTLSIVDNDIIGNLIVYMYDKNFNFLTSTGGTYSFTTSNNTYYIRFRTNTSLVNTNVNARIQLEEGTIATDYEDYFERTANVYLNSPLLQGDEIVVHDGKLCHYHKMGKETITGSNIRRSATIDSSIYRWVVWENPIIGNSTNGKKLINDKYPSVLPVDTWGNSFKDGLTQNSSNNLIILYLDKYKDGSDSSKNSLIEDLNANPINVIYYLAEPYYEIISSDKLLLECTNNSTLHIDTVVPTQLITFKAYEEEIEMLEANTQYRISFKRNKRDIPLNIKLGGASASHTSSLYNSLLITTPTTLIDNKLIIDGQGCNISECVITKGDIEYSYFEGMKSVGQDDINGHKVEITSQNKNLFDGEYELGYISTGDGYISVPHETGLTTKWIKCKPNTKYIAIGGDRNRWLLRNRNGEETVIGGTIGNETPIVTTLSDTIELRCYFRWGSSSESVESILDKFQIEEGSISTNYIKGASNKKEISLNEPLRGLPNRIKDKFVKIGGKWYIERNCYKVTLDGTQSKIYQIVDNETDTHTQFNIGGFNNKVNSNGGSICDKLAINPKASLPSTNEEGIACHHQDILVIRILKSKLNSSDTNGFKAYLKDNPITVVYQLATPVYEPLEIDPTLSTYLDVTHISNDSLIPCNMKIQNSGYNAIIKPSTLYTVALDTNKSGTIGMNLGGAKGVTTNNVLTLTTPAILADDSLRLFGKGIKGSKVRLLEGNKTNWVPSYFEGMKSSFEDKFDSTDNTYKIEILSNNKNLLDVEENLTFDTKTIFINLKKGKYTVSYKSISGHLNGAEFTMAFHDGNKTITYFTVRNGKTFNLDVDCNKIHLYSYGYNWAGSQGKILTINTLQIAKGEILLDAELKKSNKIQFSSIEPLRGVGNVKDRFIFKDGKLMIERNCDEVILNGNENWRISPTFTQLVNNHTIYYDFPTADKFNNNNYLNGLCNKFKVVNGSDFVNDTESIVLSTAWWDTTKRCSLRVQRSKLSSTNLNSFKEWLSENPIKVVYDLSEPTYEEIPFELQKIIFEGYENGTLFFDTNIPPTATVTYSGEAPLVSSVKYSQTEVSSNTTDINDNIVLYLMDMDYRVVCLQLENGTESLSMARLFGGSYEMLKRDISSKRYSVDEYRHRLEDYLSLGKITEDEFNKLGDMLNE